MSDTKMRVYWIPQINADPTFYVDVSTVGEARKILITLADYDLFRFANNVKPDYANAGGLEVWDESVGDWVEWEDDDGNEINIDDIEG